MAKATSIAVLTLEALGVVALWSAIPIAWMWIGGRIYVITESLALDLLVAFGGFLTTAILVMRALTRLDRTWVGLRRRAGHDQVEGALTQVVVVSTTMAIVVFYVWFHFIERGFIIPFMPLR